jgi:hypothetical protein
VSSPNWDDLHTADEWADVLDEIAEKLALRYGDYGRNSQIRLAAQCLRDLSERVAMAAEKADELASQVATIQMKARAALESLSKLP